MTTKKLKDLAVKVGTYESQGKTKNRYLNVGAFLETDDGGKFILLDRTFNPAGVPNDGKPTVLISMFDVKKDGEDATKETALKPENKKIDDEIPF